LRSIASWPFRVHNGIAASGISSKRSLCKKVPELVEPKKKYDPDTILNIQQLTAVQSQLKDPKVLSNSLKFAGVAENYATLVLAGAGSGKTKVIVHRVAHLLTEMRIPADNIFVATFTNKAARELVSRVRSVLLDINNNNHQSGSATRSHVVPAIPAYQPRWIGTFHGLALRMLRLNPESSGFLKNNLTILDENQQKAVIKKIILKVCPAVLSLNVY
jgi:superfamily I DNA/RNA helicase